MKARTQLLTNLQSASAWGKLGEAFHSGEFSGEARFCYSNAAVLAPTEFRWPYLRGLVELADSPDGAISNLTRAAELCGTASETPRYQLAHALVERGRHREAEPHLQTVLARNPLHAAASLDLARVQLARGSLREATQALQPAMTNRYTMRPALLVAAQIAQQNGQNSAAAQLSGRATGLPRPMPWPDPFLREVQSARVNRAALAEQANALLQQGRTDDAEALLRKLLTAFPQDSEGLLLLGRVNYQSRRCSDAETLFRRHLAVQPGSLNGLIQLGLALLCQEKWNEAIPVLKEAALLKPDFAQAHANLGVAYSRLRDSTNSIRSYREALRCAPGDFNSHIALAEELANFGDLAAAREHVERAARINPNEPRVKAARVQLQLQ